MRMKKWTAVLTAALLMLGICAFAEDNGYETMVFGNYGGQEIIWDIVTESEGKTLLFAQQSVALMPYHNVDEPVTWETCSLRAWLNGEFLNEAFSEEERAKIVETHNFNAPNATYGTDGGNETDDRVFLFSSNQAQAFFRMCKEDALPVWWWVRMPGGAPNLAVYAINKCNFFEYGNYVTSDQGGVRPAIWVELGE